MDAKPKTWVSSMAVGACFVYRRGGGDCVLCCAAAESCLCWAFRAAGKRLRALRQSMRLLNACWYEWYRVGL